MKTLLNRFGNTDTTLKHVDYRTAQIDNINDPSLVKENEYELFVKEFFHMKELILERKQRVDELNKKIEALENNCNNNTTNAFSSFTKKTKLDVKDPFVDIKEGFDSNTKKNVKRVKEIKEKSPVKESKDTFLKSEQAPVPTDGKSLSMAFSLEYTQDELKHIKRTWAPQNKNAKKIWKIARKNSRNRYKKIEFEIYNTIDIELQGPDSSDYEPFKTRICAMIESAIEKATIPEALLLKLSVNNILLGYTNRLEAIVEYLDYFYDADIRFIATLLQIALHMSYEGALYTDSKCLPLIKYASSFLKIPVTDDEFLEKLLYFVEYLFRILQNEMPLRSESLESCSDDDESETHSNNSYALSATNLIVADCRNFTKKLCDEKFRWKHIDLLRYSYLSDLKLLSESTKANENFVEFEAFNQGVHSCLKNFNLFYLMLNKTFLSMKLSKKNAQEQNHSHRVDKKLSVEYVMFMRMMKRLKCISLILFLRRLENDSDGLNVLVGLLSKNPFSPNPSRHFKLDKKFKESIHAVSNEKIKSSSARKFYKDLSGVPEYKLSATFENTKKNIEKSIKKIYSKSFFISHFQTKIEELTIPDTIDNLKCFVAYMESFLKDYSKNE